MMQIVRAGAAGSAALPAAGLPSDSSRYARRQRLLRAFELLVHPG